MTSPTKHSTLSKPAQDSLDINCAHKLPANAKTLRRTAQLDALLTVLRDELTPRGQFIFVADRIIRLIVEEGLNHLPVVPKSESRPFLITLR